jgi:hypothetical protein
MPKLSVYVADELWQEAKQAAPSPQGKPNNSQVVQRALEQMVRERQAQQAAFSAGAVRDEARLTAAVARLRDEARQEYEAGYAAGLELVEMCQFFDLRVIKNVGGLDTAQALDYIGVAGEDEPLVKWLERYGGAFEGPEQSGHLESANEPFRAGAAQAVEDAWQALRANAWGTAVADANRTGEGAHGVGTP